MMASSTNNKTSTNLGSTTVTTPSSKKPCVRQGFSFLICAVLLVGMTYLSVPSGVINVTSNIVQGVVRPAAYNDTGWAEIVDDVGPGRGRPDRAKESPITVLCPKEKTRVESCKGLKSNWSLTETPPDPPDGLCSAERKHFAFVKVHKAGSTTPYTVFQRFGRKRHLQFVLPSNERVDVGWPYLMKKEDYLQPIPGRPFDLLVDHTVYNREIFRNLLPNDTVYLAIVREPYSHLKSVLNWYSLVRKYGLQKTDPVDDLLKHPGELDRKWLVPREHKQPFSYTRNFMSYDLGLPIALADDETYVREYIAQLDRDFLLVLVLEYFDESLVLLKRYMCWQLTDILYKIQNSLEYGYKEEDLSPKMKKIHRNWSRADYLIYEHFNRTLWDKIAHEGEDFFNELARFKEINQMTTRFCDVTVVKNSTADKRFGATRWNDEFVIDGKFCGVLNTRHLYSLKRMHVEKLRNKGVNMPWPKWLGPPPKNPPDKKQPQPQNKPAKKKQSKSPAKRTVTFKRIKSSKKRRH